MIIRRFLLIVVVALGLAGCATVRHQGRVLTTPDQQQAYQADVAMAQRVCVVMRMEPCPLQRIVVYGTDELPERVAGGVFPTGIILLNQRLYEPEAERYRRAVLAHEFSHVLLGHHRDPRCQVVSTGQDQARGRHFCEHEADLQSVNLLVRGWGMEQKTAVELVYAKLLLRVDVTEALGSHAPGCWEILTFARAFRLPVPRQCIA